MAKSSFQVLIEGFQSTLRLYPRVLRVATPSLIALHLAQFMVNQFCSYATETIRASGREDIFLIASTAALELTFNILWTGAWMIAVVATCSSIVHVTMKKNFGGLMIDSFNQVIIEQIRAMAAILWRAPLLVVPALVEYVRLTWVPLIVIEDENYRAGKIDVLTRSRFVSRGRFWMLTLYTIASVLITWGLEQVAIGGSGDWIWTNPVGVTVGTVLSFFITLFFSIYLYGIYSAIVSSSNTGAAASAS